MNETKIEELFPGLNYVKLESDSRDIWWPALVAMSWKGLMTLLPTDLKAKATIVYLQMDKHERIAEKAWIYVLGKSPGNRSPLMAVTREQAQTILCDFYENLDVMDKQFGLLDSWSEASSHAEKWLREHNQIHSVVSCPSGDVICTETSNDAPSTSNVSKYPENLRLDISTNLPEENSKEQKIRFKPDKSTKHPMNKVVGIMDQDPQPISKQTTKKALPEAAALSSNISHKTRPKAAASSSNHMLLSEASIARQEALLRSVNTTAKISSISTNENTPRMSIQQKSLIDSQTTDSDSLTTFTSPHTIQSMKVSPQDQSMKLMSVDKKHIPKLEPFNSVFKILKDRYGWRQIKGSKSSLVNMYYVTGCYDGDSIEYIKNNLTLNEQYFTSQEAVESYLKKTFGWRGSTMSEKGKIAMTVPDEIEKHLDFKLVWSVLQKQYGFHYRKYSPYYFNSNANGKKFSDLKEGEDYFMTEDDLKSYINKIFGWVGPKGKEFQSSETSVRSIRKRVFNVSKPHGKDSGTPTSEAESKMDLLNTLSEEVMSQEDEKLERVAKKTKRNDHKVPSKHTASILSSANPGETSKKSHQGGLDQPTAVNAKPDDPAARSSSVKTRSIVHMDPIEEVISQYNKKFERVVKKTKRNDCKITSKHDASEPSLADLGETSNERISIITSSPPRLRSHKRGVNQETAVDANQDDSGVGSRSVKTRSSVNLEPNLPSDKVNKCPSKKSLSVTKRISSRRNVRANESSSDINQDISTDNVRIENNTAPCHQEYNISERDLPLKLKLDKCSKSLCITNTSDDILFTGTENSSSYSIVKDRIISFMKQCLSKDTDRRHSSVLNICGRPGTGKTTIAQHCLRMMDKDSDTFPNFKSIFLNAASLPSSAKLLEEIAIALGKKASSTIAAIEKKLSFQNTIPLVVVIDEIDFLMAGYRPSKSKEEIPLEAVLRWGSNPEFALTLICISNSVGDDHAKLLHKSVKIGEEVIVRTYTETDLMSIITNRLGIHKHLVDARALTFIARKVAKLDGDARLVLDLMSSAIIKAKESLSPDALKQTNTTNPVVCLPHVMSAMKNSGVIPLVDRINALPSKAKTILTIATTLGQVSSSWSVIRLNQLKKYCVEATRHEIFDELTTEGFYSIIGYLEDAGLIFPADSDDVVRGIGFDDPGEKPIRLGVQMDDVEIALEKTLFTENSFYTKLRDYVKSNDIDNTGNYY